MIADVLQTRISEYAPSNAIEQENVLQELMQHYVLASLAKAGFFSKAVFHGGTCLRILYGMNRFSEDLDFLLKKVNRQFQWSKYLRHVRNDCAMEGIPFEIQDKSEAEAAVKKAFLKTDSIGKILLLELPFERRRLKKVRIKLEIDTNPPEGSGFETAYITFPGTAAITTQTLESGFATKSHALLCRTYVKGRDWYDFVWYVSRKTVPNLQLLSNALYQQGPWEEERIDVTPAWFVENLRSVIKEMDWAAVRNDAQRFLPTHEQDALANWNTNFFLYHADQLARYLRNVDGDYA